jgi:U3 small nucleolar RNA-associated protein 3
MEEKAEREKAHGRRGINRQILKAEGLKRYRKRENKNPRVRHKNKFKKAEIKRKSMVQEYKGQSQVYGGELSGIKTNVIKSVRL